MITHPNDCGRPLFLSFDPCHVLKNVRNQFVDPTRPFYIDEQHVILEPLELFFRILKTRPLKLARLLTRRCLYPTTLEKQKVRPAVILFSQDVIAALKFQHSMNVPGFQGIEPTINFMETINRWWNMHDITNTTQHKR